MDKDIELAKQIDKWCELHQIPPCDHKLVRLVWCEALRADKQGEAVGFIESALSGSIINPDIKATLYAKYAIGENKLKEGAELYTNPPDQSAKIARLREVEDALIRLVQLKFYKSSQGKDDYYEREQPLAWEKATQVIAKEYINDEQDDARREDAE
jgi:hypothetical protein